MADQAKPPRPDAADLHLAALWLAVRLHPRHVVHGGRRLPRQATAREAAARLPGQPAADGRRIDETAGHLRVGGPERAQTPRQRRGFGRAERVERLQVGERHGHGTVDAPAAHYQSGRRHGHDVARQHAAPAT